MRKGRLLGADGFGVGRLPARGSLVWDGRAEAYRREGVDWIEESGQPQG